MDGVGGAAAGAGATAVGAAAGAVVLRVVSARVSSHSQIPPAARPSPIATAMPAPRRSRGAGNCPSGVSRGIGHADFVRVAATDVGLVQVVRS